MNQQSGSGVSLVLSYFGLRKAVGITRQYTYKAPGERGKDAGKGSNLRLQGDQETACNLALQDRSERSREVA